MNNELHNEAMELLVLAQSGDARAQDDLIVLIQRHCMMKRISKYINKNRQADNDDVKQEFLIGVGEGVRTARLDTGDPIEFIMYKGMCRVRSYFRKSIVQGTVQVCLDCGTKSRMNKISQGRYQCRKCGSMHVEVSEIDEHNELVMENIQAHGFEDDTISQCIVDEFRSTLAEGTKMCELYDLLMSGMDRDNPAVKNYISEIASMWGGCSNQNVVQNLKKLRAKFEAWSRENNLDLVVM